MNIYDRKVVLVTGSSRGLGKEIVRKFASEGFDVVINYFKSKDEAFLLRDEIINKYNVKAIAIYADVSLESDVLAMLDEIDKEFHHLDVLVNNAGISNDSLIEDKSIDSFNRVLEVNLSGTYLCSKYFGKYMYDKGFGSILNIASNNGIDSYYPYSMDYDASKAGVISLTHNFANLYAPKVRVNAIAPGWIDTSMNKDMDPSYRKEEEEKILLGRFALSKEISKDVYYIAVESSYMNDSIVKIDGGKKVC